MADAIPARTSRRTPLPGASAAALGSALLSCAPARNPREISLWNFYGPGGRTKNQIDWFVQLAADWNATHDVKVRLRYRGSGQCSVLQGEGGPLSSAGGPRLLGR